MSDNNINPECSPIGATIIKGLYDISEKTFILLNNLQQNMTRELHQGILNYFYEKVLNQHLLESVGIDGETLTKEIYENILKQKTILMMKKVDDITETASLPSTIDVPPLTAAPPAAAAAAGSEETSKERVSGNNHHKNNTNTNNNTNNTTTTTTSLNELWREFFQLCWVVKNGLLLEERFKDSNSGHDLKVLELSVKYEKILYLLKNRDRIPSHILLEVKSLENKNYLPFSPNLRRIAMNEEIQNSSSNGKRVPSYYQDEEDFAPKKRGRKKAATKNGTNKERLNMSETDKKWWSFYDQLVQYKHDHGHFNVPDDEVIFDEDEGLMFDLGNWLIGERDKFYNYSMVAFEKYEALAECMCNGLWTDDGNTSNQKPSFDSSSSIVPQTAPLSDVRSTRSSETEERRKSESPKAVASSSSSSTKSNGKSNSNPNPDHQLLQLLKSPLGNEPTCSVSNEETAPKLVIQASRKSGGTVKGRAESTILLAESKNTVHHGKRQEKMVQGSHIEEEINSSSPLAEPKSKVADPMDTSDDDEEVAVVVSKREKEFNKPVDVGIDACVIYRYGHGYKYIGLGIISENFHEHSKLFKILRLAPHRAHDGVNAKFLPSNTMDIVSMDNILFGNIEITKESNTLTPPSKMKVFEIIEKFNLKFET